MNMLPDIDEIPEGELGVALDQAMDTAIEAESAAELLSDTYGRLDSVADSGDLPADVSVDTRSIQHDVGNLQSRLELIADAYRYRANKIRERMEE